MSRFEITNPNGSLVFVRGTRVAPFAKFSANLDQAAVQELKKYGVSVTPILVSDTPAESPVEAAPIEEAAPVELPVDGRKSKKSRK